MRSRLTSESWPWHSAWLLGEHMLVNDQHSLSTESNALLLPAHLIFPNFLLHSMRDPAEIPHLHSFTNIPAELPTTQKICYNRSNVLDFRFTCICHNTALKTGAASFIAMKQRSCAKSRLKCVTTAPARQSLLAIRTSIPALQGNCILPSSLRAKLQFILADSPQKSPP